MCARRNSSRGRGSECGVGVPLEGTGGGAIIPRLIGAESALIGGDERVLRCGGVYKDDAEPSVGRRSKVGAYAASMEEESRPVWGDSMNRDSGPRGLELPCLREEGGALRRDVEDGATKSSSSSDDSLSTSIGEGDRIKENRIRLLLRGVSLNSED